MGRRSQRRSEGVLTMGCKQLASYAAKNNAGLATPFELAGAPVSGAGGSFAGRATTGSLLVDNVAGRLYVATAATSSSVTWTVVGSHT